MTAAEILGELVAIPTPSAVSNLPLLNWVRTFLEPRGWQVQLFPYEGESGIAKANLIARPSALPLTNPTEQIDLAFVCHTDTVPYATNWSGALTLQERDGQLHGCGSCDVKGALACFLAAVSTLDSTSIRPGIALILTADEEIGCKGMDRLLATGNLSITSAIVSEPTSLHAGIAGKGYGLARITVEGREAHSAFPQQGISAISVAARLIVAIEAVFETTSAPVDPLFDPPRTTLNIGVIEGGTVKNILPGRCTFLVEWRPIPGEEPARIPELLQTTADEVQLTQPAARIYVECLRAEPGFSPATTGPLQQQLAVRLGTAPTGISFGSEASRVARIASEVIVIGPGDMRTAHSERECVPLAELNQWTSILQTLIATT